MSRGRLCVHIGLVGILEQQCVDLAAEQHGERAQIDDDAADQIRDLSGVILGGQEGAADRYIEELAAQIGSSYAVKVASSDALVQLSSFRSGVLRMSARELHEEVENAHREMGKYFSC